ncbi:FAD-dependent oxidoreductase [Streptomyces sp. CA2R106]|uniref:FAD-dependent oxidoreductase n=1 Tax=Streptomyces sp. CA2R106 TaxID=3120153 RepID=UPI003008A236
MREDRCDVLVVGSGLGGVAAALAAARHGRTVVLTEATDWIGGQLTTQGVPPDEHPWIEEFGCTRGYRTLRDKVRAYYRRNYPLTAAARADERLNPGAGRVSRLCHEPRVAVAVLEEMLAPYRAAGRIRLLTRHEPVAVGHDGDRISSVTLRDAAGQEVEIAAPYTIDATELGDLLELGKVEHVTGAESAAETGEPHALDGAAEPLDQQAVSWCFALEHRPGEDHTIDRPAEYAFWRDHRAAFWPGPQLGWAEVDPWDLSEYRRALFVDTSGRPDGFGLWDFRRVLARAHFAESAGIGDVTLVNWAHIDYWLGPIVGVLPEERDRHLAAARGLSRSFLYWMQTDAPNSQGGTGFPGLRLRPDVLGTQDGFAKAPYIREARRIRAEFTVTELHVGTQAREPHVREGEFAAEFADTVGIGSYRIDLHPSTGGTRGPRTFVDIETWPFQIPLGALLPVRVDNLLPAAKNIGTTHITNGCYRLHPVEWNIGEAAGALAAHCLDTGLRPRQVRARPDRLADFQRLLTAHGVELSWPQRVRGLKQYY